MRHALADAARTLEPGSVRASSLDVYVHQRAWANATAGSQARTAARTVVEVPGDHSLRTDLDAVRAAVRAWLPAVAFAQAR